MSSAGARDETYDLAIIGGGIQGAGVAQAAAAAGYRALLIERSGWGAGTSSKSTKLIHGGLRYLRHGELRLVRESLRERRTLERIAPHLIWPDTFHIPVYRASRIRPWQLYLGLTLYRMLAGRGGNARFQRLPRSAATAFDGLQKQDLQAIFSYHDARTDDRRLTGAVARSAAELGAELTCPAKVTEAQRHSDRWLLTLSTTTGLRHVSAQVLINCAGPWADQVAATLTPAVPRPAVELVQGSHLLLARPAVTHCYYLEVPEDGRAIFLLPWEAGSLLGTTETPFSGDPDDACITPWEEAYLLRTLRYYFPSVQPDITARFAGLRVLPAASADPFRRSREVILVSTPKRQPTYIAVYGGKLTGYRATAGKVVRLASRTLGHRSAHADTARLRLPALD